MAYPSSLGCVSPSWTSYAAVSREWQVFSERRTVAVIGLFNDDVKPFFDTAWRGTDRLAYVGRLRLTIDLPEYTCSKREADKDVAPVERGMMFLEGTFNCADGIQLELGVRSISDGQNAFGNETETETKKERASGIYI
ncbi:hypothetical protein F503_06379 [Ophiostoma piceae UAMH 11346]|uniref:Uncharacterized protein n=1 Tax=Ophiostoma piceae (strain UAMH 11346) TaxID=1262450 RepID=S3CVN2_OPHP1|nr:hypothetical protein F503_06379 [Ophiostoma piceae UAMH 11346]